MLIPNCREDETYNEDFLNDKDKYEQEVTTVADAIRNMTNMQLAAYLHSWQVENMSVEEIKEFLESDIDNWNEGE